MDILIHLLIEKLISYQRSMDKKQKIRLMRHMWVGETSDDSVCLLVEHSMRKTARERDWGRQIYGFVAR